MELLLKRNKPNLFRFGNDVTIYPGVNRLTDENLIELIKNKEGADYNGKKYGIAYQALIDNGVHEELSAPPSGKSDTGTSNFTDMNSTQAIKVIKETYSVTMLEEMLHDEKASKARKGVMSAIEDQIKEMKNVPEDRNLNKTGTI